MERVGEVLCSIMRRWAEYGLRPSLAFIAVGIILGRLAREAHRSRMMEVKCRALWSLIILLAWFIVLEIMYDARAVGGVIMWPAQVLPFVLALWWVRRAQ